jgi:hypothetical protein
MQLPGGGKQPHRRLFGDYRTLTGRRLAAPGRSGPAAGRRNIRPNDRELALPCANAARYDAL